MYACSKHGQRQQDHFLLQTPLSRWGSPNLSHKNHTCFALKCPTATGPDAHLKLHTLCSFTFDSSTTKVTVKTFHCLLRLLHESLNNLCVILTTLPNSQYGCVVSRRFLNLGWASSHSVDPNTILLLCDKTSKERITPEDEMICICCT